MSFINSSLENKIKKKSDFNRILINDQREIISFLNPFSYSIISNNVEVIDKVDHWFCDGSLLVNLTNLRRKEKIDRVSFDFSSVANDVFDFAQLHSIKVAFIGSKSDEINVAISNIKEIFKDLNIVYHRDGYFGPDSLDSISEEIINSGANFLIIGTGTPKQEILAIDLFARCNNVLKIFTCGGFLTQTSLKPDYYHPLVKRFGLRWLQRAIMHSHVRKRLIVDYPIFIIKYLLNVLMERK